MKVTVRKVGSLHRDFTPLTEELLNAPILERLRLLKVSLFDGTGDPSLFDGTGDPSDYLGIYSSWARAYGYSDAIKCRLFDTTISGEARR